MNLKHGFPPLARRNATVLILGSIPGDESLRKNEYYGNPRNAFWQIMAKLFKFDPELNYTARIDILKENNIALWDVIKACERHGSLDMNINRTTVIENDFISFFRSYPRIRNVYFNGMKAESEFKKRVLSNLPESKQKITYIRLPSTSQAMTRLTFREKFREWSRIKYSNRTT